MSGSEIHCYLGVIVIRLFYSLHYKKVYSYVYVKQANQHFITVSLLSMTLVRECVQELHSK